MAASQTYSEPQPSSPPAQSLWSTTFNCNSCFRNTNILYYLVQPSRPYLCLLFSSRSAAVATLCLVSLEATTRCTTASSSGTCSASMNFTIPSLHCSTPGKSRVTDKKADVTVTVAPQLFQITASACLRRSSHALPLLACLRSKYQHHHYGILCYTTPEKGCFGRHCCNLSE